MKKILLATTMILIVVIANAQQSAAKENTSAKPTESRDITSLVEQKKVRNGKVLLLTKENGVRIYATYKNRKISNLYAIDENGKRIDAKYNTSSSGGLEVECFFCVWISDPNGGMTKTCTKIPCPEKKSISSPSAKTAN